MQILVLNGGSSSIKFSMFLSGKDTLAADPEIILDGELSGIGTSDAAMKVIEPGTINAAQKEVTMETTSIDGALSTIFDAISHAARPAVHAVGYRVVHPGAKLRGHHRITAAILKEIEEATSFAPLHNPEVLKIIRSGMRRFPEVAHYACFDTVFHETMPEEATMYALPSEWREWGIRRYGFHGLSCEWIVRKMRDTLGHLPQRMIILHLGSGCSVTAVLDGQSIDTSMGFTPTGGVVMGTRPGDLDPGILMYLIRRQQEGIQDATLAIESVLNHKSGLVALSGLSNDMRTIRSAVCDGNEQAKLAVKVFERSIVKAVGSYVWLMGGVDAIVFTGGIGEHDSVTRANVLAHLRDQGITLDETANASPSNGKRKISSQKSLVQIYVVPAEEDLMIAIHVASMDTAPANEANP